MVEPTTASTVAKTAKARSATAAPATRTSPQRPLRQALEQEGALDEAVGRADELQHLDLRASPLKREPDGRADDGEHRSEHDHGEQRSSGDGAAHEPPETLGPDLVRLDVVD